ncbi:hypothetical protein IMG5_178400 [Ichthyophthirius multifiliis]|uniref:Ankyrin repeat protein n=1 Tax=Ichthyophthirius multifiliis TaxID=5932 RepID=G0R2I4_ICHMU|nr:hypothetical protein IMG5_178400 [Ichthyophthirius multifiliis]EGR28325.1 hypothetical protein IMG5_178400 [Ichthyophthirius multifiliis]|eukprot:XP_004027670.1 hypothetical protein IMG5_178400 [Ichthyophthirius multifiliis]
METEINLNQIQQQEEEGFYASYEEYFLDCCRFNDIEETKFCIENGCDITWFDNQINNGLHWATINNQKEIVSYLIETLKVDANIQNSLGKTAFDEAAQLNYNEIAQILAKVTKEDMSIYQGLDDVQASDENNEDKEETISNS